MNDPHGRPGLSIIFPLFREQLRFPEVARDLGSFFQRMGSSIELVFVAEPSDRELAQTFTDPTLGSLKSQWINNPKHLGRGPSVLRGLEVASGEFLISASADLSTPLGDLLKLYQEFLETPAEHREILVVGNRSHKSKAPVSYPSSVRRFFEGVEAEKMKSLGLQDPTSPVIGMSRSVFLKLNSAQPHCRRWFYSSSLVTEAKRQAIPVREVAVFARPTSDSRFSWWQSLFA